MTISMSLPEALRLYFVVGEADCAGRPLTWVVEEAVQGGVTAVQLREKESDSARFAELAKNLRSILDPLSIPLVVNDDLEAAVASGAAGLHVGQGDMPTAEAREQLPARARLGLSITNREEALAAEDSPADHLGIGPVFATASKADASPAIGVAGLADIRGLRPERAAVAIGGISAANAAQVMESGVDGLAVVSTLAAAPDPKSAARELRALIEEALFRRTKSR